MFKYTDAVEAHHLKAEAQVDKLAQLALARAFRGKLAAPKVELARGERRSYESASDVLERIRHQRAAATSS